MIATHPTTQQLSLSMPVSVEIRSHYDDIKNLNIQLAFAAVQEPFEAHLHISQC